MENSCPHESYSENTISLSQDCMRMHVLSLIGALLLCVFLFGLVRPSLAQTPPNPWDDDPRTAIELYFQAHALGKAEFIERAFTPDCQNKIRRCRRIKRVDARRIRETIPGACAGRIPQGAPHRKAGRYRHSRQRRTHLELP